MELKRAKVKTGVSELTWVHEERQIATIQNDGGQRLGRFKEILPLILSIQRRDC